MCAHTAYVVAQYEKCVIFLIRIVDTPLFLLSSSPRESRDDSRARAAWRDATRCEIREILRDTIRIADTSEARYTHV